MYLDHSYFIAEYLGVGVPHVFEPYLLYCGVSWYGVPHVFGPFLLYCGVSWGEGPTCLWTIPTLLLSILV